MKWLTEWALTSSVLILIVLAVRLLFRNKLSARLRYALWAVVLARLLVPFQVELPAKVSESLPPMASNLAPETARWEEPTIPVFPQEDLDLLGLSRADLHQLEPGEIIPTDTSTGYWQLSQDGEAVIWYLDVWSPAQIVRIVWGEGAFLMALLLLVSNLRFLVKLEARRKPLAVPDVPLPVYTAEGLPSPCLFGIFRPAVYVTPEGAENPDALRHVLAHELTHYRHKDHIWSLLRCLVLALHWYNPLMWLAVVLSKRDGELACDEGAVARLGEGERIPYGRTLVDMVARRSRPADLLSCSTAMTGGKKSIQERVARLVRHPKTVKTALFAAVAVVALSVVFVFAARSEAQTGELAIYRGCVERAGEIQYSPSPLSSEYPYFSITDDDLLSQARVILLEIAPLDSGEEPDLTHAIAAPSISVIGGGPNGEEVLMTNKYMLLTQGEYTYAVRCWEADGSVQYEAIGRLPATASPRLAELGRQQEQRVRAERRGDLTQEQVDRVNEAFRPDVEISPGEYGFSEISCFFTSSYDDPTQIDLKQFLMYCPLAETLEHDEVEEFRALMEIADIWDGPPDRKPNYPGQLPVPVWRYPREKVSALLQKYAGVTVEALDWSDCLYVEEYDAFYNFTSDAGPGFFPCTGGQVMDNTVLLWSDPDENGDRCELTLRKDGDRWLIQSHHTIYTR